MNYNEALNYIHSLGNFSLKASLERIRRVLCLFGNPQNNFKAIHIAGTNGKGSTAVMLSCVFESEGYKTGLFVSPYIVDFRERIQINGEYISESDVVKLAERVKGAGIKLTEFEFITAMAFIYFSEQKCDVAVIETGLGGRLDATNALDKKEVSVITKIGLDHTLILGDTIEEIAAEKCGIIKDSPVVTVADQQDAALSVIKNSAKVLKIPELEKLKIIKSDFSSNEFIYTGVRYKTRLAGKFQIQNALAVIEAVSLSKIPVKEQNVVKGIEKAQFPARLESFMGGKIVLDGAHNPDGAGALLMEIENAKKPITAIIGMMQDKDIENVLKLTLPNFKYTIALTATDTKRAIPAERLACMAKKYCSNVITAENYVEALSRALCFDGEQIFIFGSLYLASGIRPVLLELK